MPLVTATFTTGGNVIIDETVELSAITALNANLTALNALLTSTLAPAPNGTAVPGSIAQSLIHSQQSFAAMSKQVGEINANLEKLITATNKTNTELAQANKHSGVANHHMNSANRTAELAVIDQLDKNNFDKKVVNATLEKAGEPPIKNDPVDIQADIQKKVSDIANLNGAMAAAGAIIQGATTAATEGLKLAGEILLDTAIGKKLVEYYYESEIAVTKLFSEKRAARLLAENEERIKALKSGSPPSPPTAPTMTA